MDYPQWFDYRVNHFGVHYDGADDKINKTLIKKDIDARDVISIHNVVGTPYIRVWYREKVEHP